MTATVAHGRSAGEAGAPFSARPDAETRMDARGVEGVKGCDGFLWERRRDCPWEDEGSATMAHGRSPGEAAYTVRDGTGVSNAVKAAVERAEER